MLLTDASFEKLVAAGITIDPKQYWNAQGGKSACPASPFEGSGGTDHSVLPVELL
jgi:hypothetical protein